MYLYTHVTEKILRLAYTHDVCSLFIFATAAGPDTMKYSDVCH